MNICSFNKRMTYVIMFVVVSVVCIAVIILIGFMMQTPMYNNQAVPLSTKIERSFRVVFVVKSTTKSPYSARQLARKMASATIDPDWVYVITEVKEDEEDEGDEGDEGVTANATIIYGSKDDPIVMVHDMEDDPDTVVILVKDNVHYPKGYFEGLLQMSLDIPSLMHGYLGARSGDSAVPSEKFSCMTFRRKFINNHMNGDSCMFSTRFWNMHHQIPHCDPQQNIFK